jgi:hypothetical protein
MKIKASKIEDIKDAKYGDLIFFYPSRITSSLIPPIDGSPFSHIAMFTYYRHGAYRFIESDSRRGGVTEPKIDGHENIVIVRLHDVIPMPPSVVYRDLNKRYDHSKLFQLFLHKVIGTSLYADDDSAMICSEAVNKWYNYKLFEKGHATPATIWYNLQF